MKKLILRSELVRILTTTNLRSAVGGANIPNTYVQDRCTSDNTYNCPTTGPWVTEWSCLTCNCQPQ